MSCNSLYSTPANEYPLDAQVVAHEAGVLLEEVMLKPCKALNATQIMNSMPRDNRKTYLSEMESEWQPIELQPLGRGSA
jgi:hypothetical protein